MKREKLDAVISDIRMPHGDGIELLKNIKCLHHQFPVVLLITGFTDLSKDEAYHLGAEAVLAKPFYLDQIDEAVIRVLTPLSQRMIQEEIVPGAIRKIESRYDSIASAIESGNLTLGRGGIFVSDSKTPVLPNENIFFNISLSNGDVFTIQKTGIVRWVRREQIESLPPGYRVEFEVLSTHAKEKLLELIENAKLKPFIPRY
ncbi:MAG: response regulator [Cryobacterium sp.]|nr:response regulator [Oligoflexia bacterium]